MQGTMSVTDSAFETVSHVTLAERIFFGGASLVCFLPVWEFFIRPGINPLQLAMLPFVAIALGGASIGFPLLAASLAGGTQSIRIDRGSGMVTWSTVSPLYRRQRRWRLSDIEEVCVAKNTWSDGPDTHDLILRLRGRKKPVPLRNFARTEDAEAARAALLKLLG